MSEAAASPSGLISPSAPSTAIDPDASPAPVVVSIDEADEGGSASATAEKLVPFKGRTGVWTHFLQIVPPRPVKRGSSEKLHAAQCRHCQTSIAFSAGKLSNLLSHMSSQHEDINAQLA